jgi:ribose transport system substrate-binding protein
VDEAALKRQMLELAQMVIVLADHRKFGRTETLRFASLDAAHLLVTDTGIDHDMLLCLQRETPLRIAVVGHDGVQTFEPLQAHPQRVFRIGFSNLSSRMPFAQQVLVSLEQAARQHPRIELLTLDNAMDRQRTLENSDLLVQSEVDLVIEYQLDAEAGNVIMDKFNRARIPVIAVDIPLPGATFFGADNYRAGFIAGESLGRWIEEFWHGYFDYLLKIGTTRVGGLPGARLQGLRDGLESVVGAIAESQVINVREPVLIDDVERAVDTLLRDYAPDKTFAIIAINDDGAVGALRALERQGRLSQGVAVGQNADVTGQEALRRPDFPFIGSTRFAPEEYGEKLLRLALKILNGEPVPPAVYQQHVFVNRDNLDLYYPKGVSMS